MYLASAFLSLMTAGPQLGSMGEAESEITYWYPIFAVPCLHRFMMSSVVWMLE